MFVPVVEFKARPPVRGPEERLQRTGQIYKHVAHQEEPVGKTDQKLICICNKEINCLP